MSNVTFQLPDWLFRSIQELVEREGYSIDQFLASAAAEKLAALPTVDYLRREDFERFLAAVPGREPIESDRMPE
jgi:hypothetical protein